jgi:hypothetical protein
MPKVNQAQIRSAIYRAEQLWDEYQNAVKAEGPDSRRAEVTRARYAGAEAVLVELGLAK